MYGIKISSELYSSKNTKTNVHILKCIDNNGIMEIT